MNTTLDAALEDLAASLLVVPIERAAPTARPLRKTIVVKTLRRDPETKRIVDVIEEHEELQPKLPMTDALRQYKASLRRKDPNRPVQKIVVDGLPPIVSCVPVVKEASTPMPMTMDDLWTVLGRKPTPDEIAGVGL